MPHLDELESQSIYLMREARWAFARLGMLWSIGKDSTVMLWLARKAFLGAVPFPLIHIDTSYKIPEMIAWRDETARAWNLDLRVARNDAALAAGRTFPAGAATRVECCGLLKTSALDHVVAGQGFDALMVGVRRDEDASRAKERYVSPRGDGRRWDAARQPPELWGHVQQRPPAGGHLRVHPLLDWTELDVWRYIARERIPVVPLYFDRGEGRRYRSLGCAPCTAAVASTARSADDIVAELERSRVAERSLRAQDQERDGALEALRRDGYL